MKELIAILMIMMFFVACTNIQLGMEDTKEIVKEVKNNITIADKTENKVNVSIPKSTTSYDTPSIINKKVSDETDVDGFGDVI